MWQSPLTRFVNPSMLEAPADPEVCRQPSPRNTEEDKTVVAGRLPPVISHGLGQRHRAWTLERIGQLSWQRLVCQRRFRPAASVCHDIFALPCRQPGMSQAAAADIVAGACGSECTLDISPGPTPRVHLLVA